MLNEINEASQALAANDADTLERLAADFRLGRYVLAGNLAEVQRAAEALTAQAGAAAAHIALRSRILAATELYKAVPWER